MQFFSSAPAPLDKAEAFLKQHLSCHPLDQKPLEEGLICLDTGAASAPPALAPRPRIEDQDTRLSSTHIGPGGLSFRCLARFPSLAPIFCVSLEWILFKATEKGKNSCVRSWPPWKPHELRKVSSIRSICGGLAVGQVPGQRRERH